MRDEDGSAAKPDQFLGTSNPLMYRFVSKVRTPFGLMMQFIFMRHNLPANDVKNAIAKMNRAEIVTV